MIKVKNKVLILLQTGPIYSTCVTWLDFETKILLKGTFQHKFVKNKEVGNSKTQFVEDKC